MYNGSIVAKSELISFQILCWLSRLSLKFSAYPQARSCTSCTSIPRIPSEIPECRSKFALWDRRFLQGPRWGSQKEWTPSSRVRFQNRTVQKKSETIEPYPLSIQVKLAQGPRQGTARDFKVRGKGFLVGADAILGTSPVYSTKPLKG